MGYRCRFCRKDADHVYEIRFRVTQKKMIIGVCEDHEKDLNNDKVYLCQCGEVAILDDGHKCPRRKT